MNDLLPFIERIKNSILFGENDFCEFKSALEGKTDQKIPRLAKKICADIAEALVAFSNSDGGELYIGVEDNGQILGVPHDDLDIEMMLNAPKSHIFKEQTLPIVHAKMLELEGKKILFFQVAKGTTEIFQMRDGRVMIRKNATSIPADIKAIQFTRIESLSREYDREYLDGMTIHDLDIPLIGSFAEQYSAGMTAIKYLQQSGLATYAMSGFRFTKATALLFAKDINKWHPRSQVRFLKIDGTELLSGDQYNVVSDEIIQGNIFELAIKSWENLRPYLANRTEFTKNAMFEQQFDYPEDACREALLNALVHRDYSNHNGIEVRIFTNKLEIKSPGALLSTLTIDDLYALDNRHESRNTKITYVLKISKYMRELGEGMKRMFKLMENIDRKKPILYSNTNWFTVTFLLKN
jgi:ATP-dependent DNA helicase RecG